MSGRLRLSLGVVLIVAGCLGLLPSATATVPDSEVVLAIVKSLLNATLLPADELPADPSVLCALRLAPRHYLRMERAYLKKILWRLGQTHPDRSCPGQVADVDGSSGSSAALSSGLLALMVLSLRASCLPVDNIRLGWVRVDLLGVLDKKLDDERRNIALQGRPLTTYYQYALAVQTLCALNATVDPDALSKLTTWALQGAGAGDPAHSLDTSSQALVALSCLRARGGAQAAAGPVGRGAQALASLLLGQRDATGHIGNVYSTALAVQALDAAQAAGVNVSGWGDGELSRRCLFSAAVAGEFNASPGALAQLLPSLVHRTYLGIPNITCVGNDDSVRDLHSSLTLRPPPGNGSNPITVAYSTVDGLHNSFNLTTIVSVTTGDNLLKVLEAAQAQDSLQFSFQTQPSSYGPYLVTVNGVTADASLHQYWQLLRAPNTPLDKGLRDYIVSDGEHIIASLATW